MRIMVFDVPAEHGGALTILNQYYDAAIKDKENEWIFVISTPYLQEHRNIKVINFPWIKRSWLHRLYFDKFIAKGLPKKYKVDKILSLQNLTIPSKNIKQTLYLHQPLPFIEKKYKITENFKFWIYQNIISKMIYKSIQEADSVIVQTKWIMESAADKANVGKEKFILKQPDLSVKIKKYYKQEKANEKLFFYPASGLVYKNHEIIVNASMILKKHNKKNYRIVFTLQGNENNHIKKLYDIVKKEKLPIDFIGTINIEKVYDYYSRSILIFPSYIETFGLPLLEARMHKSPIIASDCAFSNEILEGYDCVDFFDPFNAQELMKIMNKHLNT